MELKIICKRLITKDLNGRITEGENAADIIGITVPRFYGEHDLSLFSFRMTAVSDDGSFAAEQLLARDVCGEENIRLLWNVTSDFTAHDGEVRLVLAGVGPDGEVIKFASEPLVINNDGRVEFLPTPALSEQLFNQVQLEAQKAADAAKRAEDAVSGGFTLTPATTTALGGVMVDGVTVTVTDEGVISAAEKYELSAATDTVLGGIKSGKDLSVAPDGAVTVNSVGGKTLGKSVPADAKFTDTLYTLPAASAKALGGIKSGKDVSVASDGTVTVNSVGGKTLGKSVPSDAKFTDTVYSLPQATDSVLGGVRVDGNTITVNGNGVISMVGGQDASGEIILPKATENTLGAVRVDGTTVTVNTDGVLSATAADHILPTASADTLGGIKSGGDVSVSEDGTVTVNSVGGRTVGASVPEDAKFTDTVYTLPKAAPSVLGGVIPDGSTVTVNEDGVLSASFENYSLPTASEDTLGGIKSGGDISVSEDGTVTVNSVGGKTVGASVPSDAKFTDTVYTLPKAAPSVLGGVIPDGSTVTVNENGVLSASFENYSLPTASADTLGGIKSGGDVSVSEGGIITVNSVGGRTIGTSVPANAKFTDTVYTLPKSSTTVLGGVKVDGSTITADANGVISAAASSSRPTIKLLAKIERVSYNGNVTVNIPTSYKSYKYLVYNYLRGVNNNSDLNSNNGMHIIRTENIVMNKMMYSNYVDGSKENREFFICFGYQNVNTQIFVGGYFSYFYLWGSNDLFNEINQI